MTHFKLIFIIALIFLNTILVNGQEDFYRVDSSNTRVFSYGLYPSLQLFQPYSFDSVLNGSRSYIHNHNVNLMFGYQKFMLMIGFSSQYIVFKTGIEQFEGNYNLDDILVSEFWSFRFGYRYLEFNKIYLNTLINFDLLKFDHFKQNNNNIGTISGTEISISNDIGYKILRLFSPQKGEEFNSSKMTLDISFNIQFRFGYSSYISSFGDNVSPYFFGTHFGLVAELGLNRNRKN